MCTPFFYLVSEELKWTLEQAKIRELIFHTIKIKPERNKTQRRKQKLRSRLF